MDKNKDTRYRILNAAINIFSKKGYHNTRVDEIVEAADTSKGGVYFYFPSKQDIFIDLVDEFANILEFRLSKSIEQHEGAIERVNAAIKTCLTTFKEYRELSNIFLIQAVGLGISFEEKLRQIRDQFVKIIKNQLDEAIAAGDIEPINTQIAAYAWMGAIYEVAIYWIHTGEPDLDSALTSLRLYLLRSVGVSETQILQINNKE